MGRDKAPKARQTTNKPSTTLITSSMLSAGSAEPAKHGRRHGGSDELAPNGYGH